MKKTREECEAVLGKITDEEWQKCLNFEPILEKFLDENYTGNERK